MDVSKKGKGKKASKDDVGGDKAVWNSEKLKMSGWQKIEIKKRKMSLKEM